MAHNKNPCGSAKKFKKNKNFLRKSIGRDYNIYIESRRKFIMEDKMKSSLKVGYTLSRYGIDAFWGGLLMTIAWIVMSLCMRSQTDLLDIFALIMVIIGMIFFFVGRIVVGMQARKLNFLQGRQRTEEEQWFLNENLDVEDEAIRQNLVNQVAKIIPGKADDIMMASKSTGVISHYFAVGKVYMSKNVFINRLILFISILIILIEVIVEMV